jgi:hypothetical protein
MSVRITYHVTIVTKPHYLSILSSQQLLELLLVRQDVTTSILNTFALEIRILGNQLARWFGVSRLLALLILDALSLTATNVN